MTISVPLLVVVWMIMFAGWLVVSVQIGSPQGDYDFGTPVFHLMNFGVWVILGLLITVGYLALT